jgi:site-specific DNA-methyltransferase (adenine-specific)
MKDIPDKSIDMILCDLPYGTTACKWDSIIPFKPLWKQYERIIRDRGAIVLTAAQPFTSALIMSNPKLFRYEWIWEKTEPTGHFNAKKCPMRAHESILVFYKKFGSYYPIKTKGHTRIRVITDRSVRQSECYGAQKGITTYDSTERYPRSVIKFSTDKQKCVLHSTQKPVALFEYLIKTYTNEGDIVLDNCIGSGTTAIACMRTNRRFIGSDKEQKYVDIANKRLKALPKRLDAFFAQP